MGVFNIRKSLKQAQTNKKKQELAKKKQAKLAAAAAKAQQVINESDGDETKEDLVGELKQWWTDEVELSQYLDGCIDAGYENMKFVEAIRDDADRINAFVEAIGVEKAGHIMMIKQKLQTLHEQLVKKEEAAKKLQQEKEKEDEVLSEDEIDDDIDDGNKWSKLLKGIAKKKISNDDSSSWSGLTMDKLNLSDILNILDGIVERTGQRCIWTTNKAPPQKYFDPAFLRPGRMDMIIKLGCCTLDGIGYLLRNYYQIKGDDEEDRKMDLDEYDLSGIEEERFTPAQVKQICKENVNVVDAITMLRKLCHPEDGCDGKKDVKEEDKLMLPSVDQITRSHSGHWFDKSLDVKDDTTLVDVPSRMKKILKAR